MELSGTKGIRGMSERRKTVKKQNGHLWPMVCGLIIILMAVYLFVFCQQIVQQNIILLGVIEKTAEPELAIQLVNTFFNQDEPKILYRKGLTLMEQSGYSETYNRLCILPYQSKLIFFMVCSFCLLLGVVLLWKIQNRMKEEETEGLLRWMSEEKTEIPLSIVRFVSSQLIEGIHNLKVKLSRQQVIHEQDNERIMHYMEDISHQLKTPLSVIRIVCEKMIIKYPEFSEEMEKCLWQVDRMTEMIRDLIKLGKFDCGRFKMNFEYVSGKALIETVVNEMEVLAGAKDISIEVKGEEEEIWFCDSFWMREIVENILKNSIEQSSDGKITLQYGKKKNMNQIIIKDNGEGFMDGREEKIFERYYLGDRTKEGGSGLGLSIAQQAIQLHFGTITALNRENGGAEFRIIFPQMDPDTIYNSWR